MMLLVSICSIIGRSATATASTRRNLLLSSSTLASLAIVATPFSSSAILASSPNNSRFETSSTSLADSDDSTCTDIKMGSDPGTGYLNAQDAAALDAELMSTPGFSLEQLMELAGLAVAEAVYDVVTDGG
eukprot:386012_1